MNTHVYSILHFVLIHKKPGSKVNHLRPNYLKNMNEEFIENTLCRDARRYLKVYSENFENDMKKAMDSVISQIGAMRGSHVE